MCMFFQYSQLSGKDAWCILLPMGISVNSIKAPLQTRTSRGLCSNHRSPAADDHSSCPHLCYSLMPRGLKDAPQSAPVLADQQPPRNNALAFCHLLSVICSIMLQVVIITAGEVVVIVDQIKLWAQIGLDRTLSQLGQDLGNGKKNDLIKAPPERFSPPHSCPRQKHAKDFPTSAH